MSRIIELKWNCSDCDTKNILGRNKQCPNCGSPREKGEMQMSGLDAGTAAETVTDKGLLDLANAGADWFCTHCTAGNRGDGDRCATCGGPRYALAEEDHPEAPGDHLQVIPTNDPRPAKEHIPFEGRSHTYSAPPPEDTGNNSFTSYPNRRQQLVGGLIGMFAVSGIAFGINWALTTHDVPGSVIQMDWSHTVTVQRWTQTVSRLWQHQTTEVSEVPPVNGRGERAGLILVPDSCRSEHFSDERYVCGSHQDCHDVYRSVSESYSCTKSERYTCGETCMSNKNGFATCRDKTCTRQVPDTCSRSKQVFDHKDCHSVDDYCSRPIMKQKCDYNTQAWTTISAPTASGTGREMTWPSPTLGTLDRSQRSEKYNVTFEYTDSGDTETTSEQPNSETEYLTWSVGDSVVFHINNLGGVSSMDRSKK